MSDEGTDKTDGVDLGFMMLGEFTDIRKCIAAVIVFAIGDDEKRLLRVFAAGDRFETKMDGIEQRC